MDRDEWNNTMMDIVTTEERYLVEILKGFIHQHSPGLFTGSWEQLIKLADCQGITGILGYMTDQFPDIFGDEGKGNIGEKRTWNIGEGGTRNVGEGGTRNVGVGGTRNNGEEEKQNIREGKNRNRWKIYLRNQFLSTIVFYTQRGERLHLRIKQMNELGIHHMLLKGSVVKTYYPVEALRTFCDIDILILQEQRNLCDDWMIKEGFRRETDWEPVYSYYKNAEFYEIHTDLMDRNLTGKEAFDWFTKGAWEHAVRIREKQGMETAYTWSMEKEYHLVYLFVHLAKHLEGTGAGIRMYLDLALMIQAEKEKLDWIQIKNLCEQMGIIGFVRIILAFLKRYLDVKLPETVEELFSFVKLPAEISENLFYNNSEVMEKLLSYTFSGGAFGMISERKGLVFAEKCGMMKKDRNTESEKKNQIDRWNIVVMKLLPGTENLKKRYTYLEDKPWLLPAAWIHRILKNIPRWRECVEDLRAITKLDQKKMEERNCFERQIGLP